MNESVESSKESPLEHLLRNIKNRPLAESGDPSLLEKRKERISRLLSKLSEQAPALLDAFEELSKKHLGIDTTFREIALFVVGGNVHGTPFKDDSDIDVVFATDPPTDSRRHVIGQELYERLGALFEEEEKDGTYQHGIIEIKGFGTMTPDQMRKREVVRLLSKIRQG